MSSKKVMEHSGTMINGDTESIRENQLEEALSMTEITRIEDTIPSGSRKEQHGMFTR